MATLGTSKNVIMGAAQVFVAATTVAKPAYAGTTPYADTVQGTVGFRNVGYTQEGVEVSYEPEYTGVEVDQVLDEVRLGKTSMRVSVNTTFAEATLENLIISWGQADSTKTSSAGNTTVVTVIPGALGEAPLERQLVIIGNGPEVTPGKYSERTYHVTRAISTESSSHALRRAEATVFPVSFRLLPDESKGSSAPYGTIVDRVL